MQLFRNFFFVLILFSSLWGCDTSSNQTKTVLDFIPEGTQKALKISQWETTQTDFLENPFLAQLPNEPFSEIMATHKALFRQLQFEGEILFTLEEKDSSSLFTLIAPQKNLSFASDSLQGFTSEKKTIGEAAIITWNGSQQTYYSSTKDSIYLLSNSEKNLQNILLGVTKKDPLFLKALKVKNTEALVYAEDLRDIAWDSTAVNLAANAAFELQLLPDGLMGNGVILANDSVPHWMHLFKNQVPQKIDAPKVIPAQASSAISLGISNLEILQKSLRTLKKDSLDLHPIFETISEIIQFKMNENNTIALKSLDIELSMENLAKYLSESGDYRGVTQYAFDGEISLFDPFYPILSPTNTIVVFTWDHFIIFSESQEDAEKIVTALENETVLAATTFYENAVTALPQSGSLTQYNLQEKSDGLLPFLLGSRDTTAKGFPLTITQLIYDRDFAHLNFVAKEASGQKVSAGLVNQIASVTLDHELLTPPQFFTNHYTYGKDIVVQDISNQLYLISANGKVLWKKTLDGPILGKINEVDILRNGKKQLAFATTHSLYILDRNGDAVAPFPKKFKDKITQPLSVFDYDNNRKYRFVITQGEKVYMYDRQAKSVDGFTFKKAGSKIVLPPQHIRIGNKDYIVIAEEKGTLNILSRTGKSRVTVNKTFSFSEIPIEKEGFEFVVITKDNSKVTISQNGKVSTQKLNVSNNYWFTILGTTKVTLDDNLMRINGKLTELPIGIYSPPQIFSVNRNTYVAITETEENRVYVFDKSGKLLSNFPVYGMGLIDLGDANKNKKLNMVVAGQNKELILYQSN